MFTNILSAKRRNLKTSLFALGLCITGPVSASDYSENERSFQDKPVDTWMLQYEADDFSDEVTRAQIIFAPKNFAEQQSYFFRCLNYSTNFSVQFLEEQKYLENSDGSLTNRSKKFAKGGFIYHDEQRLKVSVDGDSENYDIAVGGQTRNLTPLFKADVPNTPDLLSMSFHFEFYFKDMPSFTSKNSDDNSRRFFKQLKQALKTGKPLEFELFSPNSRVHKFSFDSERLKSFAPENVLEFCVIDRELRDE
ncbi:MULTISPECIES: hypothetical protein [Thiomicrorhabdus]|uniref:Uncharacterized protein n=1 Tax=Thiomicrorhabdus heinhorstiae TaxID=2748010 RepID=A0ABS0BVN2_9GAMM|nr:MULTISPECIES: hypothetical protein [Thiomicrorhabdus]MBF6057883.1 hypothetical protein [Thiomicrorhabdus heinhorstiae]